MGSKTKSKDGSKTSNGKNGSSVVTALGESTLTGVRGAVGGAVARPVAKRTRWSEEQIRTAIGLTLLAYALYRLVWPAVRAVRTRR
jgi:hypothetical protein